GISCAALTESRAIHIARGGTVDKRHAAYSAGGAAAALGHRVDSSCSDVGAIANGDGTAGAGGDKGGIACAGGKIGTNSKRIIGIGLGDCTKGRAARRTRYRCCPDRSRINASAVALLAQGCAEVAA